MKNILLAAGAVLVLMSSCNTAYRTTATPDDLYYSAPAVQPDIQDDRYLSYDDNNEDRYLQMKVRNRYQWDGLDDFSYWNDSRYDFGYTCSPSRSVMMNPYNPYYGFGYGYSVAMGYYGFGFGYYSYPWNLWYSPYSTIVYYKNPKAYGQTSKSYLTGYRNGNYNNSNRSSFGGLLKSAFSNNSPSNNANYNNNNNRTYTPSRTFSTTPSSNAGGRSGGYNSSGSSATSPRSPR